MGQFRNKFRSFNGLRVNYDLIGTGVESFPGIVQGSYPAAYRERKEQLGTKRQNTIQKPISPPRIARYVKNQKFIAERQIYQVQIIPPVRPEPLGSAQPTLVQGERQDNTFG